DARDGAVDPRRLIVIRAQGGPIILGGLSRRLQLDERVRYGEIRLLHRWIERTAALERQPGSERGAIVAVRRLRPAGGKQRFAGEWPIEPHPIERLSRRG